MNPNKKVFFTFLSFVLAMLVIACSCGSIFPTPTVAPPPLNPPSNTIPDLIGQWQDPETLFIFTIAMVNDSCQVTSIMDADNASVPVTSQSWDGSKLTWSVTYPDGTYTLSYETISASGDSLFTNWSDSDGSSGIETLQRVSTTVAPQPPVPPEPQPNVLTNPDSLTVTSTESGVVTSGTGVSIIIPAGVVPPNDDGSIGSMIFSIAEDTTTVPSLPGGYVPVGPVVNLGPDGFVFEQPVTIFLPIPSDVDLTTVFGASYYDPGQDTWILIPGTVNEANRTIEVSTTHFTTYTGAGFDETTSYNRANGAEIVIYRPLPSVKYKGPDNRYDEAATTNGICIQSVVYADPAVTTWFRLPRDNMLIAANTWSVGFWPTNTAEWTDAGLFWLPTGTYELCQIYLQSEVNSNPLYVPQYYNMYKPYGTLTVEAGQRYEFPVPDVEYNEPGWTLGRPPCLGTRTTSTGTGGHEGVQVTLNWNSNADLDLHVIEPGGEEIYYGYLTSSAGGTLDRDNTCGNFELGKPENIFWTTPPTGTYQVNVVYFQDCGDAGPVNFTVRVCIKGNCGNPISGTVNAVDPYVSVSVTSFEFP